MGKGMKRRDQGWMGRENNENEFKLKKSLAVVDLFLDLKLF